MARKRGMQYIPYDYEAAYNKAMEDMHEWFIENLFQHRKKVIYALKEITAGDQFEIEIYPQFRNMDEVPPEGRTIKKDNNKAQKNLNDKNARKYVERLINENFSDRDIWMTLTYDDAHLPPDGDVDAAIKNVQKYIRRINYQTTYLLEMISRPAILRVSVILIRMRKSDGIITLSWTVRWTWRRLNHVGNSQAGMRFADCRQMKTVCLAWQTISSKKRTVFRRKRDGTVRKD